jgi:hypothetical protein
MTPGQAFTKTWRVRNSGKVDWGLATQLIFFDGTQMGGPSPTDVGNVEPGDTADISVAMVAPASTGSYTGKWSLRAADGTPMMTLSVVIVVASPDPVSPGSDEVKVEVTVGGETRTYYLPCGSPIPPGAVCVCNCVATCACVGHCACDGHCSCDRVCTCDTVHYWYPN